MISMIIFACLFCVIMGGVVGYCYGGIKANNRWRIRFEEITRKFEEVTKSIEESNA